MLEEKGVEPVAGSEASPALEVKEELKESPISTEESLNEDADDLDEPKIPRRRFNEAVQKEREKYAELVKKTEGYQILDEYMRKDESLNAAINDVIRRYNNGELTKKEMAAEIKEETQSREEVPSYVRDIEDLKLQRRQDNTDRYVQEFISLVSKDAGDDQDLAKAIEADVYREFILQYPEAQDRYHRGAVEKVYKSVMSRYELYNRKKSAAYVQEKSSDSVPVSHSGGTPTQKIDLRDEEQRHKMFIESMTKGV